MDGSLRLCRSIKPQKRLHPNILRILGIYKMINKIKYLFIIRYLLVISSPH